MLEATLNEAVTLKRILDGLIELMQDVNLECNTDGINLKSFDAHHVAAIVMKLHTDDFVLYRCDHPTSLGVNVSSLSKAVKCARDTDRCTLKLMDNTAFLSIKHEARYTAYIDEFAMKLKDIDSDSFYIPDFKYDAHVTMSSSNFSRIVRHILVIGERVHIEVSEEAISFSSDNESTHLKILVKQTDAARQHFKSYITEYNEKPKKARVKKGGGVEAKSEGQPIDSGKRRKHPSVSSSKAKSDDSPESRNSGAHIEITQNVKLPVSRKYLVTFSKCASLSDTVQLRIKNKTPLLVLYRFGHSYIQYHLAPMIDD